MINSFSALDCATCGAPVPAGAERCEHCGTKYFISPRARFLYLTPDELVMVRCPTCYSLVPLRAHCPVCHAVLPRTTRCEQCQQLTPLGRNCRNCGDLMAEIVREHDEKDTRNPFVREIEAMARQRLQRAGNRTLVQFHERYDGNLEVLVGDKAYPSVKEIQDEAVRKEIEAAVAEWQSRM